MSTDDIEPAERTNLEQTAAAADERFARAKGAGRYEDAVEPAEVALLARTKLYQHFSDGHPDLARSLNNVGFVWGALGQPGRARPFYEDALEMRRRLYPTDRFPDGHPDLALSLNNVAAVWKALGQPERARPFDEVALEMNRRLYPEDRFPDGHPDLARSLNNVGGGWQELGQAERAQSFYEHALEMNRRLYPEDRFPDGHPDLARSLNNVGFVWGALGQPGRARPFYEDALEMNRRLYPEDQFPAGHPDLARSLNNMGFVWQALGQAEPARSFYESALEMNHRLYPEDQFPDGHPDLARSLNNVGFVWQDLGQPARARPFYEDALEMNRRLYPEDQFPAGHPYLLVTLNNMGFVWSALGQPERARPFYESALEMRRRLYSADCFPDGHPDLVVSLNNVAAVWGALGQPGRARPFYEDALEMNRRLYPEEQFPAGHPDLARSLNNVGFVWGALGEPERARPFSESALEMRRRLYPEDQFPDGHPDLALSLHTVGFVWQALGQAESARPFFEGALEMRRRLFPKIRFPDGHPDLAICLNSAGFVRLALNQLDSAKGLLEESIDMQFAALDRAAFHVPDATTLTQLQSLRNTTDLLLSVLAEESTFVSIYPRLWRVRGYLFAVLRARHAAALAQQTGSLVRDAWDRLGVVRGKLAGLLAQIPTDWATYDRALAELEVEQEQLEDTLASHLPELERCRPPSSAGPQALATALPDDTAFVEFVRSIRWVSGRSVGASYVAFIVAHTREPVAIDLGDSELLDAAIVHWRNHIDECLSSTAPHSLRHLLWEPLERNFSHGISKVYLCPDGDLWRLPFAALPGRDPQTVLADGYTIAVVPSGAYLLEQLLDEPTFTPETDLLAVGGVDYGPLPVDAVPYPALPGTAHEARYVCQMFGCSPDRILGGTDAQPNEVATSLCKARYAHIATHGYFDFSALAQERQRSEQLLQTGGVGLPRSGVGLRNPLGYVGLALAGANASNGEGVLTGLGIVDLPLESLKLCVLSACETGGGALTEGEGVAGLQRAFHIAGCQNVVCSLWEVDDDATAALMVKFYHEHLIKKGSAINALRVAQLTIYRHPDRIGALAGRCGEQELKRVLNLPTDASHSATPAPTVLWAGFMLSGLGWWRESPPIVEVPKPR